MIYDYTLRANVDTEAHAAQCSTLESIGYFFEDRLVDVDGSIISKYRRGDDHAEVWLDCEIGATYVLSDADISKHIEE